MLATDMTRNLARKVEHAVQRIDAPLFLPTTQADLRAMGWAELDVLIVTGDAYVDHPAFGPILIARWLASHGYKVGVVAQPSWRSTTDLTRMGRPRLFVGIGAGNLDSMLCKLTAQKKVRSTDPYSPGGRPGRRPNRATIVYSNLCRQAFPGVPIIIGGIEASLRRIAHYDYWSDTVRRSILLDAKADVLVFGMGERAVLEIARRLDGGASVASLTDIRGTGHVESNQALPEHFAMAARDAAPVVLPSYGEVKADRRAFARMTRLVYLESNPHSARPLVQVHGDAAVWLSPPSMPLSTPEIDALADLPFCRLPHPSYTESIPAFETTKHSIAIVRGCFGGCAFCSIALHEGRAVQSRSHESVVREARALRHVSGFRGVISDVGGPTANLYGMRCTNTGAERACRRLSCLYPRICDRLDTDAMPLVRLLRTLRGLDGVRHVFVASGIRHDLALRGRLFVRELAAHHTGGHLSTAPEHIDSGVLQCMFKPDIEVYERFEQVFASESRRAGKEQYLTPYFMTGHPGSEWQDTIALALYLKRRRLRPRQVQEFIPTPSTFSTAMYHTRLDPMSLKPVNVITGLRERRMLKALLFYWDKRHWPLAREALHRAGRADLIGSAASCLVPSGRSLHARWSEHRLLGSVVLGEGDAPHDR